MFYVNKNKELSMNNKLYLLMLLLPSLAMSITVGDKVWLDTNQDWEQNQGESGLANITIDLYDADNQKIKSTVTDSNGNYQFENLEDKQYFIEVVVPSGYQAVTQKRIAFWENEDLDELDFGLNQIALPTVKGLVWNDKNKDWVQNNDWEFHRIENGLENITVELFDENNNKLTSTKTDKDGHFSFKVQNLKDKIHFAEVVVPSGYTLVTDKRVEFGGEYVPDLNFGLFKKSVPLDPHAPITKEQLRVMIRSGKDVTDVNTSEITDMSNLFYDVDGFKQDISRWDTSNVTNMSHMFRKTFNTNPKIGSWDVSNVTDMSGMFASADGFNQDISNWDTSSVTDMNNMFNFAAHFNQPLNDWNVSNVTNMSHMFNNAQSFNQPLNNWDVSNVTNMSGMFDFARKFNQPLNSWNVSNVTNMSRMFKMAHSFNQPLNNWDVFNVTNMTDMFFDAKAFNQDISNWNVSNVEEHVNFTGASALENAYNPFYNN